MTLLVQGSRGQEVKNLQTALNYHLLHLPRMASLGSLVENGFFGPKTYGRVVEYQSICSLEVDGKVGPETQKAVYCFVDLSIHSLIVTYDKGRFQS